MQVPTIPDRQVAHRWLRRETPIPPSVIARSDLRTLFARLQLKVNESVELQIGPVLCPAGTDPEEWQELKNQVRRAANLTVFVIGTAGEEVVTTEEAGLADQHLPDRIQTLTFDAGIALKNALNIDLQNRFVLKLDFTSPPDFGEYEPTSRPTPNSSTLEVSGPVETWVSGVHDLILQFFQHRATPRSWLHSHWVFLALHWVVVLPASIWTSYRLVGLLPSALTAAHPVFTAGLYVYCFYLAFVVFRVIKLTARKAWPHIELKGEAATPARLILSTISLGLVVAIVYDFLRLWFRSPA